MYVICMLYVCYMYVICMLYVCYMYVICMLYVCYMYVICMLYVAIINLNKFILYIKNIFGYLLSKNIQISSKLKFIYYTLLYIRL